jgi:hypothetical protein
MRRPTLNGSGVARLLLAGLLLTAAVPSRQAVAGACNPGANVVGTDINPCQRFVQPPLTFGGLHTHTVHLYCDESPYRMFYGAYWQVYNNYSWDNQCFTVTENSSAEDYSLDTSLFVATVTNWCVDKKVITITLGCTSISGLSVPESARSRGE